MLRLQISNNLSGFLPLTVQGLFQGILRSYELGNALKYAGIVFILLVIIKTFPREIPTPQGPSTLSKTREIYLPGSHG